MSLLSNYAVTVRVLKPTVVTNSPWEPTVTYTEIEVPQCLWQYVSTRDEDAGRELWDSSTIRVDFPKEFTARLAGCHLILPDGRKFAVDGDPYPLPGSPLPWNRWATCRLIMEVGNG